jgi:deoxyxylulose-5-phosphate synthase
MLLIENKILYTLKVNEPKLKGYDYSFDSMKYPNLFITPIDDAISAIVFCYGEMLSTVEKVARELLFEEEIFIKIVCPSLISEINFNTVEMENVHIVVIEEGNGYASWGSQISDYLSTNNVTTKSYYHFKNDNIIPSSKEAEINTIPGIKDLKEYILQI